MWMRLNKMQLGVNYDLVLKSKMHNYDICVPHFKAKVLVWMFVIKTQLGVNYGLIMKSTMAATGDMLKIRLCIIKMFVSHISKPNFLCGFNLM